MSIDYEVYVGPYVECKTKTAKITVRNRGCTNPECVNFERPTVHDFCPACGQQISMFEMEVEGETPDVDPLMEDDQFCAFLLPICNEGADSISRDRSVQIFTPNQVEAPGYLFDPKTDMDFREMEPETIQAEKTYVEGMEQMARLRDFYGDENVEVKWGILNWWS